MGNISINPNYGPYSLKHVAINKLFGLGQAQDNKVVRYTLNSTMALTHYNTIIIN
jgi:hypothetical protein